MPFIFGDLPPEIQKQIEDHQKRESMSRQDYAHQIRNFMLDMSEEDLENLTAWTTATLIDSNFGHNMLGQIEMLRSNKFDTCACGEKHDDMSAVIGEPSEEVISDDEDELSPNRTVNMIEYSIEKAPFEAPTLFVCSNCGIGISSIEDRMKRPPGIEGCSGCQQKSAWG